MIFKDIGLSPEVLRAVDDAGYETPTPIQEKAIPYVLQGRDLLGCAQTGTGKTAGFTLPMIDILSHGRARARMPRALILEPTRELAFQVAENFEIYGKYQKLSMALLIGGVSFADQAKKIDRGVDVLIATPGRLLDHVERGQLMLTGVQVFVIDEADRMLDMGFIPDIERIVKLLPPLRQTLFFSATMPPEIRRLADKFLSNPREVSVAPPASPAETVRQGMSIVRPGSEKREALRRLMRAENAEAGLIFCNRKRDVDILMRSLKRHGFNAAALHGDMSQPARMETLENFKSGEISFLVASDVAARGLDISGLPYVFNFDVPTHAEDYIHRIGRTGRAGRPGTALTLATSADGKYVSGIERLIGKPIPKFEIEGSQGGELDAEEPRRGRGRGRGRGGEKRNDRGRARSSAKAQPEKAAAQEAKSEPVASAKPAKAVSSAPAEKPVASDKTKDKREAKKSAEPKPEKKRNAKKSRRDAKSGKRRESSEKSVGFADNMPAFMARPVELPARTPKRDKEAAK